jgi:AcrR family transcriptional regulator
MAALTATDGPLRERLLAVVDRLLVEEGVESLTLRRVAREAGVSHGAPLRHFPSLGALLAEVAAEGFRDLSARVRAAAASAPPPAPPLDRLAAAGRAYVEAAVGRPALFTLMFRPDLSDYSLPALQDAGAKAFEDLVDLVRAAQDDGWRSAEDTRVLAGALWASVHGLALLWAQGVMQGVTDNPSLDDAVAMTLRVSYGEPGPPIDPSRHGRTS